jgi:hypothetical protein
MIRRTVKCADRQRRPDQHPQRGYGWDRTAWIAPKEPGSGQGTGSWPTTWSRSGPWPANRPISQTTSNRATAAPLPVSARDLSGRSSQTLRTPTPCRATQIWPICTQEPHQSHASAGAQNRRSGVLFDKGAAPVGVGPCDVASSHTRV